MADYRRVRLCVWGCVMDFRLMEWVQETWHGKKIMTGIDIFKQKRSRQSL